jgi:hypothetical protein
MHTVVQVSLDRAAVRIPCQDEASQRRAELLGLGAQPPELLLCFWPSLQGDRLPS